MLTVEEYCASVVALARPLPAEDCRLDSGFGRVLDEDVVARFPVPPFTNSAMDGFAVRAADLVGTHSSLEVVGDIPAGALNVPTVGSGQAARIMTGAPLPPGADAVVPVEDTDQEPGDVPLPSAVAAGPIVAGKNVRYCGEDVRVGDTVIQAGSTWTPAAAASAASVGYASVALRRRPLVAVLSTGSELVAPGQTLRYGEVPDSNSVLLAGLVEQFGGTVAFTRAVPDEQAAFHAALTDAAAAGVDVVVTSGAVSAGAFEVVRQVLGGDLEFVTVAMQPGKPQASGRVRVGGRDIVVLALPGNPVSVFVSAWVYLRPLLAAFQGVRREWPSRRIPAAEGWAAPPLRRQYVPVLVTTEGVRRAHPLGSGSHLVASIHRGEALAVVPEDVETVHPGDLLEVFAL